MEFKLTYTTQDLMTLNRVHRKVYRRWGSRIFRVLALALGVLCLPVGISLVSQGNVSRGVLDLLLGLVLLALSIFYDRANAWQTRRMLLKNAGELTVTLEETGIRERSQKGEAFYAYEGIIGCYHCRGRYLLFIDKLHGIILPEDRLVRGGPDRLAPFLAERCGKEILEIH